MVGPGEPLWLTQDAEDVLEYFREQALRCPGCGLPRDETMDPEAENHYRTRALRCHACAARDRTEKRFTERGGLFIGVERF